MTNQNGHICKECNGLGQFQDSKGGWWDCVYCDSTGIHVPAEKKWWSRRVESIGRDEKGRFKW